MGRADVAFGSKADLTGPKSDFRFTFESGLKSDIPPCPFRAKTGSSRSSYSITWSARGFKIAWARIRAGLTDADIAKAHEMG